MVIQVKIPEVEKELQNLKSAMNDFDGYSKSFIKKASKDIKKMNSDFTENMTDALDNMTDTKAPKLQKALESYYKSVKAITETFEAVDQEIKGQINLNK